MRTGLRVRSRAVHSGLKEIYMKTISPTKESLTSMKQNQVNSYVYTKALTRITGSRSIRLDRPDTISKVFPAVAARMTRDPLFRLSLVPPLMFLLNVHCCRSSVARRSPATFPKLLCRANHIAILSPDTAPEYARIHHGSPCVPKNLP